MGKRILLLHPGYGKTGTTTLQRSFFNPLGSRGAMHYLGMFLEAPRGHPDRVFFEQLQCAMYLDGDEFQSVLPALKRMVAAAAARSNPALPIVISNEHFLLSAYSTRQPGLTIEARETAHRLAILLDDFDVRILVGLRRPDRFLHSFFVESAARTNHANRHHFTDLSAFVAKSLREETIFHSMLQYDEAVESYRSAFPGAPAHVYLFESFVRDQKSTLLKILNLVDVPADLLNDFELPLPDQNKKNRRENGIEIGARHPIIGMMRSLPGGESISFRLNRIRFLRKMYALVRPTRVIPHLAPFERDQILLASREGVERLLIRYPHLAHEMADVWQVPEMAKNIARISKYI